MRLFYCTGGKRSGHTSSEKETLAHTVVMSWKVTLESRFMKVVRRNGRKGIWDCWCYLLSGQQMEPRWRETWSLARSLHPLSRFFRETRFHLNVVITLSITAPWWTVPAFRAALCPTALRIRHLCAACNRNKSMIVLHWTMLSHFTGHTRFFSVIKYVARWPNGCCGLAHVGI